MKRFFTIAIASVAVVGVVASVATAFPETKQAPDAMEQAKAWAHIDTAPSTASDDIVMQGDSITVYADEINRIAARYKASGVDDGKQRAEDYVLRREALYQAGVDAGFTASDKEVQDIIDQELEWEDGADGQEYFQSYLDEAGLTAEEYWNTQRDVLHKEIIIGKYLDAEREKTGITDADEWEQYEDTLVQNLITDDHVATIAD